MHTKRPHNRRTGFTLVELLITIGIIGVLIGILSPAIRGALAAAGRIGSLSNLRQLGITVEAYLGAHQGVYPALKPGRSYPVSVDGRVRFGPGDRWSSLSAWPGAIAAFAPLGELFDVLYSPGSPKLRQRGPGAVVMNTSYRYSNSFVAQPALWTPGVTPGPEMLAEARTHQVEQPAAKVMFWDVERAYDARWLRSEIADEDAQTPMLFADGHADVKRIRDAADAVRNPLNSREDAATMKLNNTPRGVRGRDY